MNFFESNKCCFNVQFYITDRVVEVIERKIYKISWQRINNIKLEQSAVYR